jgi:hypothetical protein
MASMTAVGWLASPRRQRRLAWLGGALLGVLLVALLSLFVFRGSSGIHSPISNQPAQVAPKEIKAPPTEEALQAARRFIETAVLRKDLDVAYALVGPDIKGGLSRKQWETGNIPVVGYPADNTRTAGFNVDWSYANELMLDVDLVAKPSADVRPHLDFWLGLKRVGGKHGRWLVDYWIPNWHPPLPTSR